MLVFQAKTEPLVLLTNDSILSGYGDCVELAAPKPRRPRPYRLGTFPASSGTLPFRSVAFGRGTSGLFLQRICVS